MFKPACLLAAVATVTAQPLSMNTGFTGTTVPYGGFGASSLGGYSTLGSTLGSYSTLGSSLGGYSSGLSGLSGFGGYSSYAPASSVPLGYGSLSTRTPYSSTLPLVASAPRSTTPTCSTTENGVKKTVPCPSSATSSFSSYLPSPNLYGNTLTSAYGPRFQYSSYLSDGTRVLTDRQAEKTRFVNEQADQNVVGLEPRNGVLPVTASATGNPVVVSVPTYDGVTSTRQKTVTATITSTVTPDGRTITTETITEVLDSPEPMKNVAFPYLAPLSIP